MKLHHPLVKYQGLECLPLKVNRLEGIKGGTVKLSSEAVSTSAKFQFASEENSFILSTSWVT